MFLFNDSTESLPPSHTHRPTFCPNFCNLSLSAFHTRFFPKMVNVRGWERSSSDAFTCVLVLGHPSLRRFCPQLSLYAGPRGATNPHQTNLSCSVFLGTHALARTHTQTLTQTGAIPLAYRPPIEIQDWYTASYRQLMGLQGHK